MNKPWKHYDNAKKPITQDHIQYEYFYMKCPEWINFCGQKIDWLLSWAEGEGGILSKKGNRYEVSFEDDEKVLKFIMQMVCITLSDQIRSAAQSCLTLCDPMNRSTPGLPVHHQLPEFTQTHVHRFSDAIQPSHPLASPSPPAPNPSQHQSLFQWVSSSHEVAKVLEFQL